LNTLGKLRGSKNAKTIISIAIIIALILSLFFSLGFILNTATPVRVVESSSMCIPNNTVPGPDRRPYTLDDFLWTLSHPFNRTLNVGDIIIIQGVDPETLNTDYPNSDIIVYNDPTASDPSKTPIVHRIVSSYTENGTLYFQTKGDGNGEKWPAVPLSSEYDSNTVYVGNGKGVPADLVEGKVIMRIPLLGWITLFFRNVSWGWPLVIVIIMLLVVLEFVLPVVKRKPKPKDEITI
jgi:signal peptidase I